jgi:D-xylose transport system permease protein
VSDSKKTPTKAATQIDDTTALPASGLIGSGMEGGLLDQVRAYVSRVRGGDMGALPAVSGFVVLSILFSVLSQFFLTERNFANLLTQAAPQVMLAMALVFVILFIQRRPQGLFALKGRVES